MNLSRFLPTNLPPIIKPTFPVPETTDLSKHIANAMFGLYRMKRGSTRVRKIWKDNYSGTLLDVKGDKLAVYLYNVYPKPEYFLLLIEPEEAKEKIARVTLFDRFNALLKRGKLPTLHHIVKDYWVFNDGVPWIGQRLFQFSQGATTKSEKEVLTDLLTLHP